MRRLFPAVATAGVLLLLSLAVRADDDDRSKEAEGAARQWLAKIDASQFEQSYLDGGSALHDKVPQDTWVKILSAERPGMGKVLSRTELDHSYRPNGFEGADGEFFVLTYRTAFATKPDEMETVILHREGGHWRGAGYDFGPEQVQNDPQAGPNTTTVTTTNAPPPSDVVPIARHQAGQ